MSVPEQLRPPPNIQVHQDIGAVTNSEIVGVKIGTLVSVYVNPAAGLASPPRSAEPYKFLDSYSFDDRARFFGRENLASECAVLILAHPTTLLVGEAAIGKSSFVHAGILPLLARHDDVAAFSVRDYQAPAEGIRQALRQIPGLVLSLPDDNSITALSLAFTQQTNKRLVIFFDQFERLFALPVELQDGFAREIVATKRALQTNSNATIHLVFVLREKFRANASALDARNADLNLVANVENIPGLEQEAASRAIAEPLHTESGLDLAVVEAGLVEQWILPQLVQLSHAQDQRVEPAPLQIICQSLYGAAREDAVKGAQPVMSLALYKKLGQAEGILKSYLNALRAKLDVNDADWAGMREILGQLAGTETLRFYSTAELADATAHGDANMGRRLGLLLQANLIQARADNSYALVGNYMIRTIREWFPEQYNQQTANAALARALSDWDDQQLLTEPRRLRRIQDARALLTPSPKAFALLLRSAVAYEAQPGFWQNEIARDADTRAALEQLEHDEKTSPGAMQVAHALFGTTGANTYGTVGDAVIRAPEENMRVASALALSTLGAETTHAALQPVLARGTMRARWRALVAFAWLRFFGVNWALPSLLSASLVSFIAIGLRVRANRIKIASVVASALTGTTLVGFIAAFTNIALAVAVGFALRNIPLEITLLVAVGVMNGAIVGVCYSIADVFSSRTHPRFSIALRVSAILLGFGLANLFIITALTPSIVDVRPFLIGALIGSGFALGNELGLARANPSETKRILFCALGLGFTAAAATAITVLYSQMLGLRLDSTASFLMRFAGGVNPGMFPPQLVLVLYVVSNFVMGAVMGFGLAEGLVIGNWIARQLDRARYT
jgi:hypothetical protein